MRTITPEIFQELLATAPLQSRIKREVRFVNSVTGMSDDDWATTELLAVPTKAGNKGVIILQASDSEVYIAAYEVSRGLTSTTGKAQPVICDFCRTWQTGGRSGSVTIARPGRDAGSITFLCCADLQCSRHVRNLTSAAKTSRAQLREDMTPEDRIERLKRRITELAEQLELTPVAIKD